MVPNGDAICLTDAPLPKALQKTAGLRTSDSLSMHTNVFQFVSQLWGGRGHPPSTIRIHTYSYTD